MRKANETATAIWESRLPMALIAVWRLVRLRSDAMVNSPSTTATARKDADSTAVRTLGRMIRHITVNQLAPSERAASARVVTSMAERPASRAR